MQRILLSQPDAPPLAELLRDVPLFADLPLGDMACVRQIRMALAEHYAEGEEIAVNDDLIVACSGIVDATPAAAVTTGCVLDRAGQRLPSTGALTARGPVLALRFAPALVPPLAAACSGIAAALARPAPAEPTSLPLEGPSQ